MDSYDPIIGDLGYPCWDHRTDWTMPLSKEYADLLKYEELYVAAEARALKAEAALREITTAQIVEAGARVERLLDEGCMNADTILAAVLTALEIPLITPHN